MKTQLLSLGRIVRDRLTGKPGLANLAVTVLLIYFFINFGHRDGIRLFDFSLRSAWLIAYSFFTANVLVLLVQALTERARILRVLLLGVILFFFMGVHAYHLQSKYTLDYVILSENAAETFTIQSLGVIFSYFRWFDCVGIIVVWIALPVVEILGAKRRRLQVERFSLSKVLFLACLYLAIVAAPLRTQDEVTGLIKQWMKSFFVPNEIRNIVVTGYPYLHPSIVASGEFSASGERPNIILVMVESFSAGFVEKTSPEGHRYTPVFDSLIPQGVYVERFYGNSVQTCRGQEATFLSVIPSMRGKVFTTHPNLKAKALPQYFDEAGYRTVFVQAGENLTFDDTGKFLERAGVEDIHSAFEFLSAEERANGWGWGPEDGLFYRRVLEHLDGVHANHPDQPVFVMLATIANHIAFESLPEEKRVLYPKSDRPEHAYADVLHLGDSQLVDLVDGIRSRDWLKNTVLVITSDHSRPANEHGIVHCENGFYEESFRIPFLMIWQGRLAPRRLTGPFSQIDIAPTLLDVAGIVDVKNHFMGRSIFAPYQERSIYLVQPYAGSYLGVVSYPFKFTRNLNSGDEYLFDLAADPGEKHNLAGKGPPERERVLRDSLRAILVNQKILDQDRLWP